MIPGPDTNKNLAMHSKILLAAGTALLVSLATTASAQQIKCWTEADGTRACGTVVPPEAIQRGYELRNSTGETRIDSVRAAPDKDKLEAEREARRLQDLKDKEAADAQRKIDLENAVLLSTYATESELIEARDSQAGTFDIRITQTEAMIRQTDRSVMEVERAAAAAERAGKEIDPALLREREEGLAKIATQRENIAGIEVKRQALMERFEQDLARYRQLTGN